ncbi:hypothetical protein FACS189462_5440 [Spirochaetia bacterium]|nr:hypothetical protein FACS189462_5440 [Spirochaetia bacterium]
MNGLLTSEDFIQIETLFENEPIEDTKNKVKKVLEQYSIALIKLRYYLKYHKLPSVKNGMIL